VGERERVTTVLLLDVLEHLAEPRQFVRELVAAFPNLRHVLVTVPARQELWSNHDEFYGHFLRYDVPQLRTIVDGAQCRASYFFHALYPMLWLSARLGMKRNVALTAPSPQSRWFHELVASAMVLEHKIVPRRVAGTSIVGVFQIN
jgi:hypothetical protein